MKLEGLKKNEVIDILVGAELSTTKKGASELLDTVDAVIEAIMNALQEGQKANVGKYVAVGKVHKDATTARNPKTGETVEVEAKTVAKVIAQGSIKKLV